MNARIEIIKSSVATIKQDGEIALGNQAQDLDLKKNDDE